MSNLSHILKSVFSRFKNQPSIRQKPKQDYLFSFQQLESRELLAGINLNAAGNLIISGGAGNDIGQVTMLSSTTVRAEITGCESQDFSLASISNVTFRGFAGNDRFTNSTSLTSRQIGGDGNDTLIGGTGADIINGGTGNDTLTGNAGNDRLVGSAGDDVVRAGDGDDVILTGDGLNEVFGDAGDDLIIGGADVDRLFGGDGTDILVGLDGDDILDVGNGGILGTQGTANADLALGFGGNDEITGGTGLNVLYGGDGDDILTAGAGQENRFHGQNGNDTLTGNAANDFLLGQNGDDIFNGEGGNDLIVTGQGDDTVNGGAGIDSVRFAGESSDFFNIFSEDSTVGVSRAGQGFDRLTETENLQFADTATSSVVSQTRAAESAATSSVTVRPIVVRNNNSSNQAEFFGDPEQELDIQLRIDEIFATAGIDIIWDTTTTFNNTATNSGGTGASPVDRLESITRLGGLAQVSSPDPQVLNMYFVNQTPSSGSTSDLSADGFAFIDANGLAFHTGSTLVTTPDFRELVARVAAHELAHNLGLAHTNSPPNLLDPSIAGRNLTPNQINALRDSQFVQPITAAGSSGEVFAQDTTPPDSNSSTGGCGGCGVCAACNGA